ncbi:MAG: zinc carboxypeptidase [Firmicutes bacterium]|nr:zinc carboxypeptidase [Bacillota bacterium]
MKDVFQRVLDSIPDYKVFMTVDEMDESSKKLTEEYPDTVKLLEIGRSRAGHPIYCLKIGDYPRSAILYGCPHPNEPIGAMLLEHLSRSLAEDGEFRDELGYTCYIIKSWDCDATRLNEGWFKGPFTVTNYAKNFFRPASHKQVEWTFPIDYKGLHFRDPLPETRALMKLMDEVRPQFLYSLHNGGFGGVYWYMTYLMPEDVRAEMYGAAESQQVILDLGEPETPYCVSIGPAMYRMISQKDNYDYLEANGIAEPAKAIREGTCSADYGAEVSDAYILLTELPYFFDKRIGDLSETGRIRKDVVREKLDFVESFDAFVSSVMAGSEKYIREDDPFLTTIRASYRAASSEATRKMIEQNPDYARNATAAEEFSNLLVTRFYKLLTLGMMVRMHEGELAAMKSAGEDDAEKRDALEKGLESSLKAFGELSAYLEEKLDYQVVPVRKLVYIQLASGLLVMDHLKKEARPAGQGAGR